MQAKKAKMPLPSSVALTILSARASMQQWLLLGTSPGFKLLGTEGRGALCRCWCKMRHLDNTRALELLHSQTAVCYPSIGIAITLKFETKFCTACKEHCLYLLKMEQS